MINFRYAEKRGYHAAILALSAVVLLVAVGAVNAAEAVDVRVIQDTGDRIVVQCDIGRYFETTVDIAGLPHQRIALGKESLIRIKGAPALPNVCRSFIIPNDARMSVRVMDAQYYEVPARIAPSKGKIYRNQNPDEVPFEFGETYAADAFFPGTVASLRKPYILRDYRGVVLEVNPFRYNPVTGTLRVYTSVTVEMVKVGAGKVNVLNQRLRGESLNLTFHKVYNRHFLNYASNVRYDSLDESGDMLIICHDDWLANVQPLVDHKNAIGIPTTAVGVSTIGNDSASIKSHIQGVYNDGGLSFVLLVGDAGEVATPYASGGSSDPSYALLAGGDNYPDIMVGRFSAQTAAQVDTQVLRTIEYEQLPAGGPDWFKKGTGIGSTGGPGDDGELDWEHIENIRADLLGYGFTEVDQIYAPGALASDVTSALNSGRGVVNYCGHGGITSWTTTGFSNTNINALTNDNMLPVIFSVACVNGKFDGYTCFGETWLRATHVSEPTGAVGVYASSINQSWDPPMAAQDESADLLVAEAYFSFGGLCFAGSCLMMDEYNADGEEIYDTWIVFGDPSLRVFGQAQPHGMRVSPTSGLNSSGPVGGPFTPDSIEYTLENLGDTPLDYEVSASQPWVSITDGVGSLGAYASTTVTVSINSQADSLGGGNYDDTAQFTNTTNGDGNTTRSISLQIGAPAAIYSFNMDTNPGWTISAGNEWAYGDPTGEGGYYHGNPDPDDGATGTNVYGVNLNGDYSTTAGGPYYLTTGPMDLTGYEEVTLKFQRWLNCDYTPYVSVTVEASNNATDWVLIWDNSTAAITDNSWGLFTYDISAVADDQGTVYVRWSYEVDSWAYAYSGWNIDDVEIWGMGGEPPPTCDDGILNQGEDLIDCGGPCPPCECLLDTDCDDGVYCNGGESCDDYGECMAGAYPCGDDQWCREDISWCVPHGDGDFDYDNYVDLYDFAMFQACFGHESYGDCGPGNMTGTSEMIDLNDFALFREALRGPVSAP